MDLLRTNGLRDSENVSAVRREQIRLLKPRSIEMNSKMKIEEHKIPVREVSDWHLDSVAWEGEVENKRICSDLTVFAFRSGERR